MLPERDHRLLHRGDRRLAARAALPRRGRRSQSSNARQPTTASKRASSRSAATTARLSSARRFRARLTELRIRHRWGGYRDPESQAFIESWFGKLKEREVWLNEHETLDTASAGYVDRYHHRPHSGLNYRTPLEVRQTWEDLQKLAA